MQKEGRFGVVVPYQLRDPFFLSTDATPIQLRRILLLAHLPKAARLQSRNLVIVDAEKIDDLPADMLV